MAHVGLRQGFALRCTTGRKGRLKSWTLCDGLGGWVMGQGLA